MKALVCAMFLLFMVGGAPCLAFADIGSIERELAALEAGVADPTQNAQNLLERFSVLAEQVKPGQTERPDLENRMNALVLALLSRISNDVNTEARQKIEAARRELAGYTGVEHLPQIKAAGEAIAETKREIIALSDNPETQFIQIDDDTKNALISLERELLSTRENICTAAAKTQCISSLPDFPEKYRNALIYLDAGGITILDLACAAQAKGFYKSFSAGGLFSNDIVLELENGTFYFKEQRYSTETRLTVGSSYAGDTFTMLIATRMESDKGSQDINNPIGAMFGLYLQFGGRPVAKECQE